MARFVARRLLGLVPVLFVILTLSFYVVRLAPGNPFASEKAVSAEVRAQLDKRYHLDQPIWRQYTHYLRGLALHFDLGPTIKYPQYSVNEIVAMGFPVTLVLGLVALLWSMLVGISAGVIGALKQNTPLDYTAMSLAIIGISLPSFVLGPLLILVFALTFYWLPPGGWGAVRHVILPGITLGTVYAAYLARLTRGGMLEVIRQDFVRTARAKGLPGRVVLVRHMLRGGLMPVVTFLGPMLAHLLTGSVVVEMIFATPGMGPYFVTAAINRDYFLVMGIVLVYSTFLLLCNLVVDIVYGLLDPRIRYT
ncbi:MAG: ABC transporter permease subunit [Myxococcota bacterium]